MYGVKCTVGFVRKWRCFLCGDLQSHLLQLYCLVPPMTAAILWGYVRNVKRILIIEKELGVRIVKTFLLPQAMEMCVGKSGW
ncbi:hypothetical protein RJT34_19281 [Clitoria ternatea]|uniref:Uncharacterized protein n=1 Tax=Clitoria ternatea TaxID=43366 RepID=A0AAN9IQX9_CLITE